MDIVYDSLFVTNPAQYQTSSGRKLCNEHGNINVNGLKISAGTPRGGANAG